MKKMLIALLLIGLALLACGQRKVNVSPEEGLNAPALLEKANQLYMDGNTKEAFRNYSMIYKRYPTSREYIDAVLGLSRCYNDLGEYEEGMDLLLNLLRENIIPSRVPEIYNEMAKYYEINAGISSEAGISDEAQDFRKAIELYKKAIEYPNSEDENAKAYAQYRIGELYLNLMKFKEAATALQATKRDYPNTIWAQRAEQRLQEFQSAVSTVLDEIKSESGLPPAPENTPPAETPAPEQVAPDTSQAPPPPPAAVDTTQPAPPDTTKKPKLEMK